MVRPRLPMMHLGLSWIGEVMGGQRRILADWIGRIVRIPQLVS